jgi:DNA-binding LacI/PurR family transcriptional regulator
MHVERDSKELFHRQLRSILLDQIKDGTLAPGQKIPSERVLSEMYGVSRTTAKAAVLQLLSDGLVVRATGKGTFISEDVNRDRLQVQQTGTVAFVLNKRRAYRVPLIEDAVYLSLSQSIQEEIGKKGMHLMTAAVDDQDVSEVASYRALLDKVDGVVIAEPRTSQLAEYAHAKHRPAVFASPSEEHPPIDTVDIDNEQTGYEATRYVLSLGHRQIAYVKGPEAILATQLRYEGFRRALTAAGEPIDDALVVSGDGWTIEDGAHAFTELTERGRPFTAVVCANDLLAIGVLRTARATGMKVPDQLSVIGCDNIELAAHSDPPLTTMDNHIRSIGRAAVRRLMDRIQGDDGPPQRILFPASIVERGTCARAGR